MREIIKNENGTKVKCSLTTCCYNSSCCISPCELIKETVCNCNEIEIETDELTGDLQCCQWEYGNKPVSCIQCQLYANDEIVIPNDSIEFETIDEDFFD